jgi:DeoR/GlpR family transcriptional regulator of sugar metabolism
MARLVSLLQEQGRLDVAGAAARFATSEMTIRRDLDWLAARGVARRVRGGAVSLLMRGEELPFAVREMEAVEAKRRIAARTGELLRDGEAIVLDSGTTALEVARVLVTGRRATVMALSLHAAMALAANPAIRLLVPGGETRFGELAMVGPLAEAAVAGLRFDTAVMSCCGVSAGGVITAHDVGEAAVKRALMASSARVILVADHTKFARGALAVVADVSGVDVVITDDGAPPATVAALEGMGVEVVYA